MIFFFIEFKSNHRDLKPALLFQALWEKPTLSVLTNVLFVIQSLIKCWLSTSSVVQSRENNTVKNG